MYQIDLKAAGIKDLDQLQWIGMGRPYDYADNTLYFNGKQMTLARWPNNGFVKTGRISDPGSKPRNNETPDRGFVFEYQDDRPEKWKDISDVWMLGYWAAGWSESTTKIDSIDTQKKTIKSVFPTRYGASPGKEYFYFNILEELDIPGEYYIDRNKGILYLYPPENLETADLQISLLKEDMVKLNNVSNIVFRGITFEATRSNGININEGENVLVDNCLLRDIGDTAVKVEGGKNNGITNNCIYDIGSKGVSVHGGDRATLTSAGHYVEKNNIFNFSKILKTYNPGVEVQGVGIRVANNLIHDGEHQAIQIVGGGVTVGDKPDFPGSNEITIEYNDIYNVIKPQCDDSGAIYSFGDAAQTGMVIRYNYLHHMSKLSQGKLAAPTAAVYLDGSVTGYSVYGNVVYDVPVGLWSNGGAFNKINNNILIDVYKPVMAGIDNGKPAVYFKRISDLMSKNEIWLKKYPYLSQISTATTAALGIEVKNNLLYKCVYDIQSSAPKQMTISNNYKTDDLNFINLKSMNFIFDKNSVILKNIPEFQNIDMQKIGL